MSFQIIFSLLYGVKKQDNFVSNAFGTLTIEFSVTGIQIDEPCIILDRFPMMDSKEWG